jgi:hypothetical protein
LFDPRYRSGATSSLIAAAAPIEPQAPLPIAAAASVEPRAPLPVAAATSVEPQAPLPIAAALPLVQQDVEEISLAVDESMDPEDVDVDEMAEEI